jgi:hypothetical protein
MASGTLLAGALAVTMGILASTVALWLVRRSR